MAVAFWKGTKTAFAARVTAGTLQAGALYCIDDTGVDTNWAIHLGTSTNTYVNLGISEARVQEIASTEMSYKGQVANDTALFAIASVNEGDMYSVVSSATGNAGASALAIANATVTGGTTATDWDFIPIGVDLSNYVTNTALGTALQTAIPAGSSGQVAIASGTAGQLGTPLDIDNAPTSGSVNLVTSGGVYAVTSTKQDVLTGTGLVTGTGSATGAVTYTIVDTTVSSAGAGIPTTAAVNSALSSAAIEWQAI